MWPVDAMGAMVFKVWAQVAMGRSQDESLDRREQEYFSKKKIAQIRREGAGELARTKYTHLQERTARSACIVQTQAQYGSRVG